MREIERLVPFRIRWEPVLGSLYVIFPHRENNIVSAMSLTEVIGAFITPLIVKGIQASLCPDIPRIGHVREGGLLFHLLFGMKIKLFRLGFSPFSTPLFRRCRRTS